MKKDTFISIEQNNDDWWLSTKSKIIIELISSNFRTKKISILDIASGTGYIAQKISDEGYSNITVSDRSLVAISILKKKFKNVKKINLPKKLLIDEKFDCILILDVLEHIENDYESLRKIKSLLKKNGKIIISVPAYEFLWSSKDDRVEHKRRYIKQSLVRLIEHSNMKVDYMSYYNFFLFLPALFYSIINKYKEVIPRYNPLQNFLFTKIFSIEIPLIRKFVKFPVGVSLISVISHNE